MGVLSWENTIRPYSQFWAGWEEFSRNEPPMAIADSSPSSSDSPCFPPLLSSWMLLFHGPRYDGWSMISRDVPYVKDFIFMRLILHFVNVWWVWNVHQDRNLFQWLEGLYWSGTLKISRRLDAMIGLIRAPEDWWKLRRTEAARSTKVIQGSQWIEQ